MPSHLVRGLYRQMLPFLDESMVFVSATKGLEIGTILRISEVIATSVGRAFAPRVAVLSGPTFAREVARGDPTALVVASQDEGLDGSIQDGFLRARASGFIPRQDPIGVEIGGLD